MLVETIRKTGLDQAKSAALAPWRKPRAVHDPGKVLLDRTRATGRRRILRFARHWPWTGEITTVLRLLTLLPHPG
ncbi:hypothetical protein ABZ208_22560 [Streptomyces sp. NPDC006208]|uniref:hypothetical protein n=1 Tax=Streptomyces sp. NPDC006208 TaxID=3156734 RepID=UPI0033A5938B